MLGAQAVCIPRENTILIRRTVGLIFSLPQSQPILCVWGSSPVLVKYQVSPPAVAWPQPHRNFCGIWLMASTVSVLLVLCRRSPSIYKCHCRSLESFCVPPAGQALMSMSSFCSKMYLFFCQPGRRLASTATRWRCSPQMSNKLPADFGKGQKKKTSLNLLYTKGSLIIN